jgi:predicted acylesterase/phospholipase RssA
MDIDSYIANSQENRKKQPCNKSEILPAHYINERKIKTPYYILSCDGGGVRSLATVSFLRKFEIHMKLIDPSFKINKFFDMYAGSSAGAIVTGLITYGRMQAGELERVFYPDAIKEIFTKSIVDVLFGRCQRKPVYDGVEKTKFIEESIGDQAFQKVPHNKCVVVPLFGINTSSAVFCSRDNKLCQIKASSVIDAASSAPTYFPAVKIEDKYYIDGGLIANNPSMCAIAEAKKILGQVCDRPIIVLNVGTGVFKRDIDEKAASSFGGIQWLFNSIYSLPMDDESLITEQASMIVGENNYLRINETLPEMNSELDNTDIKNMKSYIKMGEVWWYENRQKVMKLFKDHPDLQPRNLVLKKIQQQTRF